jgi:EpsD family peptidyl-prolyl cis-trans isomerase
MRLHRVLLPLGSVVALCAAGAAIGAADKVLATVDGEDITSAQVRLEMQNAPGNAAVDNAVLQGLINRKLLAAEAKKRELDKTPIGAMQLKRADDFALVEILAVELVGQPSPIPEQDVAAFINGHPTMFAQRRLISLNQFIVDDASPELLKRLKPLETMAQFENVLLQDHVQYRRTATVLDTIDIEPSAASQIAALGAGEVFITPRGPKRLELSEIADTRVAPLTGAAAQQIARNLLTTRQRADKLRAAVNTIVGNGKAKVQINPDYSGKPARKPDGQKPTHEVRRETVSPPAA